MRYPVLWPTPVRCGLTKPNCASSILTPGANSSAGWGKTRSLPAATLRENVLLARPDAREDELQSVLDRAWVSEFLPLLPQGVDTVVGDQSAGLSVGQAQRVAVARALLNPCQLMLLDEPAASLDAHSEQRVMHALNAASLQQTTLMVTHQLEGIADWDQIWVMENGHIVEQGDYASRCRAGAICHPAGEPSGGYLMRALLPYLALYKRHKWMLTLGLCWRLSLLASIGLLTLSGWFLSASAVAGVAGLYSFNYMLPAAGVRGTAITRTAGRYFERLVSHDATFRVLQHLRLHLQQTCPSPCRAGAFSPG
jgi:ABC-type transport system involved in cytochrome bd biosynthesis fused ATPase/permease subunit